MDICHRSIALGCFDAMRMAMIRYQFPFDVIGKGLRESIFNLVPISGPGRRRFTGSLGTGSLNVVKSILSEPSMDKAALH
ncbi:hypothetical protein TNCV_2767701 [Trichonephila clavipes]|nr:hypothetical protein TNCV_2767701 [Trichonephila clavipes]